MPEYWLTTRENEQREAFNSYQKDMGLHALNRVSGICEKASWCIPEIRETQTTLSPSCFSRVLHLALDSPGFLNWEFLCLSMTFRLQ